MSKMVGGVKHCSLLTSTKIQEWKWICTGLAVAWEKVHMPQFAEPGMAPLHASLLFQPSKRKVGADEKLQIQLCWPHRDLRITARLLCFKHHLVVESYINQNREITCLAGRTDNGTDLAGIYLKNRDWKIAKKVHRNVFNVRTAEANMCVYSWGHVIQVKHRGTFQTHTIKTNRASRI